MNQYEIHHCDIMLINLKAYDNRNILQALLNVKQYDFYFTYLKLFILKRSFKSN
ncbi:hypothetical protein pb186bvf_007361 [Paramecium bursaria]